MKSNSTFLTYGIKSTFLILFIFLNLATGTSQANSTAVLTKFTFDQRYTSAPDADEIYRLIFQYISTSAGFKLVAREQWEAIHAELELQKREGFIDGLMVEQGKNLGAEKMFFGHVINSTQGIEYATVQLVLVDVATSAVLASEVLSPNGRTKAAADNSASDIADIEDKSWVETTTKLATGLMRKSLERNVEDFLEEYFPISISIARFSADDKEVEELWLYGQKKFEFRKRQVFEVVEQTVIENPDGSKGVFEEVIGLLKVNSVQGDYAICKVSQGEEELIEKHSADNIIVRKKSGLLD